MLKRLLVVMGMVLVLAACGGNDTPTAAPPTADDTAAGNSDEFFTVNLTGAQTAEITGDGVFNCRDSALIQAADGTPIETPSVQTISVVDENTRGVTLFTPPKAGPGTYEMVSQTNENIGEVYSASAYLSPGNYTEVSEGSITLEQVATGPDEPVVGSFTVTLANDAGDTVNLEGSFNFLSLGADDGIIISDFYCE